jgi:zinc protease
MATPSFAFSRRPDRETQLIDATNRTARRHSRTDAAGRLPAIRLPALGLAALTLVAMASPGLADAIATSFRLQNGIELVVIPDRRAPIVTHMVWYKVGSADEEPGKSGIAHFFEHLLFKGTSKNPAGTFDTEIADIGGTQNAFTTQDFTAYFQVVPPSALPRMMELEADRMRNLVLTEEVVATERQVVLEERRSTVDSDPQGLLGEEVRATLYQNHPYRLPVIGWEHEIAALTLQDARDFYDRHYRPDNAIVVVAGDVEPEQVRAMAETAYGALVPGEDQLQRSRPQEPPADTRRTVTLADGRVSLPSVSKSWIVPSYTTAAPGEAEALDLLSEILGGGTRSRLYQELVVKTGLAASIGANYDGDSLDATGFVVYGAPQDETRLADLEAALDREMARIVANGVNAAELERAKRRYVRAMVFARDSAGGLANMFGQTLATGGTVADVEEWSRRIEAVTADQVKAAAARLRKDIEVVGYLLPQPAPGETP